MNTRKFAFLDFERIGEIEPERQPNGMFREYMPQSRYKDAETKPLHDYGSGPFCKFRIGRGRHESGLYVLTIDENPVYVGECVNLGQRWGPNGYGGISPRNCFQGGQPTNCRINAAILKEAIWGKTIELWFSPFEGDVHERQDVETQLIGELEPSWNRAKRRVITP